MTTHNSVAAFTFAAATLFSILSSPAPAQQVGYINGETIQSFDLSTGQILSSFQQVANVAPIAVSKDGNTLYSPQDNGSTGSVHVLSASDGSLLSVIPGVTKSPHQTRLSPSGNYVYVMSVYTARKAWVSVFDLNAGAVVRYIHTSPGYPLDIALSPDGKQLFLASLSAPAEVESAETQETHDTSVPISGCPLSSGICVFDTATFKLTGLVFGVTGFLAASQDGNTLYCLPQEENPTPIYAINTASLKSFCDHGAERSVSEAHRRFPFRKCGGASVSRRQRNALCVPDRLPNQPDHRSVRAPAGAGSILPRF